MILQLCSGGYRFYLTSCIDVDECLEGSDGCDAKREACVNTEGGRASFMASINTSQKMLIYITVQILQRIKS